VLSPTTPTAGQVFSDGRILDIVQSGQTGELRILIWDGVNAIRSQSSLDEARIRSTFAVGLEVHVR